MIDGGVFGNDGDLFLVVRGIEEGVSGSIRGSAAIQAVMPRLALHNTELSCVAHVTQMPPETFVSLENLLTMI